MATNARNGSALSIVRGAVPAAELHILQSAGAALMNPQFAPSPSGLSLHWVARPESSRYLCEKLCCQGLYRLIQLAPHDNDEVLAVPVLRENAAEEKALLRECARSNSADRRASGLPYVDR